MILGARQVTERNEAGIWINIQPHRVSNFHVLIESEFVHRQLLGSTDSIASLVFDVSIDEQN